MENRKTTLNKLSALAVLGTSLLALGSLQSGTSPDTNQKSFAIFFYESPDGFASREGAKAGPYWEKWTKYIGSIQQSGTMESGSALKAPKFSASLDGKGAKTVDAGKVQLSGYVVVRAKSLEEATTYAKSSPAIADGGRVEVREILPMTDHTGGN